MKTGLLVTFFMVVLCAVPAAMAAPYTESFDSFSPGALPVGWTNWTGAPQVISGGGVNNTNCLNNGTASDQVYWTAHPFSWVSDVLVGQKVTIGLDFQSALSGNKFDDDRIAWAMGSTDLSNNQFGVQVDDQADGGLVTYYRTAGGTQIKTVLNALAGIQNNTWYRLQLDYTKLSNTAAKLDALVTALDGSGNPTANTWAGGIADTSALGGNAPNPAYFSTATLYPSFKNYFTYSGNADNAVFGIIPEPASMILLALGGLALLRRRGR